MALFTSVFRALHPQAVRAYEGLPGPSPSLPLGNLPDFLGRQTWDVVSDYSARYGGAAVAWLGSRPVVAVGGRQVLEHVLFDGRHDFQEPHPTRAFLPDAKAPWRHDSTQHVLSGHAAEGWLSDRIQAVAPTLRERARALAEESADKKSHLRLMPPLRRVTFDILSQALIGRELGTQAFEDMDLLVRRSSARLMPKAGSKAAEDPALQAAAERWRTAWASRLAEAERFPGEGPGGAPAQRGDLLGRMLRMDSNLDRQHWTNALSELCLDVALLVPSMVATTLHFLGTHPDWAERLRGSLAELPDDPSPARMEADVHLDAILRESLRLWAPVPLERRRALPGAGLSAEGPPLPEAAELLCSSWGLRSDAHIWGADAEEFRPERWNNKMRKRHPIGSRHFYPLGAGRRAWTTADVACTLTRAFLVQWTRTAHFSPPPRQLPSAGELSLLGVRMPMGLRARVELLPE